MKQTPEKCRHLRLSKSKGIHCILLAKKGLKATGCILEYGLIFTGTCDKFKIRDPEFIKKWRKKLV